MSTNKRLNAVYYRLEGVYYYVYLHDDENKFYRAQKLKSQNAYYEALRIPPEYNALVEYKYKFIQWVEEAKSLNYMKACNNCFSVLFYFNAFLHHVKNKYPDAYKPVKVSSYIEFHFLESTFNGGKQYVNPNILNIPTQCYGYDYSSFYPNMMVHNNFRFPVGQFVTYTIKNLDQYKRARTSNRLGIYHMRITSKNPNACKVFAFSPRNMYTSYCIDFALEYQELLGFEITILPPIGTTEDDVKFNCIEYDRYDTWYGHQIFGQWFVRLSELKEKYPKNLLVKHCFSSLHGTLTSFNYTECEDDDEASAYRELADSKYKLLDCRLKLEYNEELDEYLTVIDKLKVVPTNDPYNNELARLKPFLTSYGRCYLGRFIINNELLDQVIRLHTDGIILSQPHDFSNPIYYPRPEVPKYKTEFKEKITMKMDLGPIRYYPKPEEKSTGRITWYSITTSDRINAKNKKTKLEDEEDDEIESP